MSIILNLMMPCVEFGSADMHSYIMNVFRNQKLCKVSEVTLIPYNKNGSIVNVCFVKVKEWFDSECAYNFINRLKDKSKETRLIYEDDNWWLVKINENYDTIFFSEYYTVKFNDYDELDVVDKLDDECPPPTLERSEGSYSCALCKQIGGGMLSTCKNVNCDWYNKSFLEIVYGDRNSSKKSVIYDDVPPNINPPASWLTGDYSNDDIPPNVIPPASWLKFGADLEALQDEWVKISKESSNNDVPPIIMPPMSWLEKTIPEFSDTNTYFCGICGESKRGVFSVCWNSSCQRYGKSIDDIYEENFNLNMKNVTFRKHQKSFQQEIS